MNNFIFKATIAMVVIISFYFSSYQVSQAAFLDVPYTRQAPFGEWNDPRQQDGCEEASILMAKMWAQGKHMDAEEVRQHIINMSEYQKYFFGYFQDSSAQDTANLMVQYYGYPTDKIDVQHNISIQNIKDALDKGYLVMVPLNPRIISTSLYNPSTTRHTVVVVGYDNFSNEIIFHDPITGPFRRVEQSVFQNALADYSSGNHITTFNRPSAMIIVNKLNPISPYL